MAGENGSGSVVVQNKDASLCTRAAFYGPPRRIPTCPGANGSRSCRAASVGRVCFMMAVGDSIYFGCSADDKVYCLDAFTGQERCSFLPKSLFGWHPPSVTEKSTSILMTVRLIVSMPMRVPCCGNTIWTAVNIRYRGISESSLPVLSGQAC